MSEAGRCSAEDVAGGTVGCGGRSSLMCTDSPLRMYAGAGILGREMVVSVGGNPEFSHQSNTMRTNPLFSPTKMRTFLYANGESKLDYDFFSRSSVMFLQCEL